TTRSRVGNKCGQPALRPLATLVDKRCIEKIINGARRKFDAYRVVAFGRKSPSQTCADIVELVAQRHRPCTACALSVRIGAIKKPGQVTHVMQRSQPILAVVIELLQRVRTRGLEQRSEEH